MDRDRAPLTGRDDAPHHSVASLEGLCGRSGLSPSESIHLRSVRRDEISSIVKRLTLKVVRALDPAMGWRVTLNDLSAIAWTPFRQPSGAAFSQATP
jgi:hypothetical protein